MSKHTLEHARIMVTAAPPTPNGDLHLGHLSGPYLAADILTRYLRLRGTDAHYMCGSDDNCNYVHTNAARLGLGAQEGADRMVADIEATLRAARIEVEQFVRPNASPIYRETVQEMFRRLHDTGRLEEREVPSPYCEGCARYLYEAYIKGHCPHCGALSGGNYCEECAWPNHCSDLRDAYCTQCGKPAARRPCRRLFFPLSRYARELRAMHRQVAMSPRLRAFCEKALAAGLADLAVSHVGDWGIPVPVAGFDDQRIWVWCEMAPRYLAYARHLGGGWERFWKADDAAVVQCFGSDNAFFYALFVPALLHAYDPAIRPPAAYVMNEFYRLDGRKFSTSRRHAIWGRDLLADVPGDVVRHYLAATCPEVESTNFELASFAETADRELLGEWQPWLEELARRLREEFADQAPAAPAAGAWTAEHRLFHERLRRLTAEAARAYQAATFSPQRAARALGELVREARLFGRTEECWRGVPARGRERRTAAALELLAAKTLALAAAPLMPDLAARLWHELGYAAPLAEQRWEDRPAWVPAGQRLRGLGGAPYFSSVRQLLGSRKLYAA
jgi:methionyl-tRNA synthetase